MEALIAPPTMISGSNAYDDGLRRSCASFKMNEDTSFTLKSATETGKSLFRSLGMVVVDCVHGENHKITTRYTSRSEDVLEGLMVYLMLFAMFTVAGAYLGIRTRRPIYVPVVLASLLYALSNAPPAEIPAVTLHYIGDVFMFVFLFSLNVQWHEQMTRPRSKRVTRIGWLIAGNVALLLSTLFFVFTPAAPVVAGSAVYCAVSIIGFAFMVKGLLKAPDWRLPLVIDRRDQWELFHRLGWTLLGLWTLVLLKKVCFIAFELVENASWNIIFFCVPDLLAAVTVLIGVWPGSVTDIHTRDYRFSQEDLEAPTEVTLDYVTKELEGSTYAPSEMNTL